MLPNRRMSTVHITRYPNSAIIPNQRNPTYRLGWSAASLGSTTALTVKGASAAGFVQGESASARDPFSSSLLNFTATTTEQPALVFRSRGDFGGTINQREVLPQSVLVGTESTNRIVRVRVVLNPVLTGTVNWTYVDQSLSCMERATPVGTTVSGGREVAIFIVTTTSSLNLAALDLRMEPGDVIAIDLTTTSATAVCQASMNWQER